MLSPPTSSTSFQGGAHDAERVSKHDIVCRVGYAAHAGVYLLFSTLAFDASFTGADPARQEHHALWILGHGWVGTVLLTLLAAGLLAYSYVRIWRGVANPSGPASDARGISLRVARIGSGLAAIGLAFYALSLAYGWFGAGGGGPGQGERNAVDVTARVMMWPGGRWLIAGVGVAVCGVAFAQLGPAIRAGFVNELAIPPGRERWIKALGRVGFVSRFVVFLIAGGFIVAAAYQAEPDKARGLGGALRVLRSQPYGPWLLAVVGAGLLAFAALRAVYARYAILPRRASGG